MQGVNKHLEAVGDITNAGAVTIRVSHHHNMVATVQQALEELVDVVLDAPKVGEEKVADHEDAQAPLAGRELLMRPRCCPGVPFAGRELFMRPRCCPGVSLAGREVFMRPWCCSSGVAASLHVGLHFLHFTRDLICDHRLPLPGHQAVIRLQ